jgi:uncharacterized protein (DUF927 family)
MAYDIRLFEELLDTTREKNRYVCPACGDPNLTISPKTGAYRCHANLCDSDAIRDAIDKLAGKIPYKTNGRRRRKLEPGTLEARVITRKAAALGAFNGPEAWMPDRDEIAAKEPEPEPESAVEPEPECSSPVQSPSDSAVEGESQSPHYETSPEGGLYWVSHEKTSNGSLTKTQTKVGNHLAAIAYVASPDGDGAGILLELKTQQVHLQRWTMPRRALGGDSAVLIGELLDRGYGLVFDQKRKLARYLTELGTELSQTYTISNATGWVNGSFLLPNLTIGDQSLKYRDVEPLPDCPIELKGTAQSWQDTVGKLASGNSRLIFAIGVALGAPLAPLLDIESGGFHYVGLSSTGKTTALCVAGSVSGLKKLSSWNSTVNGLEAVATAHNHLLLPLDEIGEANPRDVGAAAYMLANGQGKQRMSRDLVGRKRQQWQLLTLSSGELSMADYLRTAGINQRGGQEVRMPDIPACPHNGQYGVFEEIHGYATAAEFVRDLEAACRENRGALLQAFLTQLVADQANSEWLISQRRRLRAIENELMGEIQDAVIGRAAKRFALVQVALELAHSYGLLPFPLDQIPWAVSTLFTDWLNFRGGTGSIEVKQCLERIESEFVKNEFSDRIYNVDKPPTDSIRNLLAYRKVDFSNRAEFWVPPAVFRELTQSVDRDLVTAEMLRRGWLLGPDSEGKTSTVRRLENKTMRVYVFTQFWQTEDEPTQKPFPPLSKTGVTGVTGVTPTQNTGIEGISAVTPSVTPENPGCNGVTEPGSEKNNQASAIDVNLSSVTPVTPGDLRCNTNTEAQNPDTEAVPETVTPVTPVTPKNEREGNSFQVGDFKTEDLGEVIDVGDF